MSASKQQKNGILPPNAHINELNVLETPFLPSSSAKTDKKTIKTLIKNFHFAFMVLIHIITALKAEISRLRSKLEEATLLASLASAFQAEINRLILVNNSLLERLAKPKANSRNSSMSPATDITRAKKKTLENGDSSESNQTGSNDKPKKRKIGAQKGHKRHARPKFKRDEANEINEFPPENTTCPKCQNQMERCPEKDRQHDQIEIPEIVIRKLIYLALAYRCPKCGKIHYGNIPENVIKTGFVGVNLQALITLLNTSCAVSIRKIQMVIQDVAGCKISTGLINKVRMGTSKALKPAFEEACKELQNQEIINADETSHPDSGKKHWLWAFIGRFLAVYKIGTRSAFLLEEFLGTTFKGIIGCDYHGAYRKFKKGNPAVKLQFCMAHLIRDCQYCFDYNNYKVREYGKKLLDLLTEMFHVYHKYRESNDPKDLEELQEFAPKITSAALDSPMISKSKGIAKRFQDNPEGYFTFMFHPGVEPTNNRAEQGIRGAVVNRKMTMGTRGEAGRAYTEIMLTVMQTCLKTGNSQHKFIKDSLNAYYEGREQPSLVALANEASSRLTSENQSPSSPKQAA